ncbi:MAG: ABC transporter ATP-binding protein [Acidimicrobiales bacterium]
MRFDATTALAGVDLRVEAGEVVVLLGRSGSGKSTLLRAVAGLQPLDAGRIVVDGVDMVGVPPHQRGIGLMFQDHALFSHLDVAANVGFGLRMRRRPAEEVAATVAGLLDLVGLPGTGGRPIQTLSGGEQQRVALARSLAPAPRLLLLDEPLGALDRPLRERLVVELRQVFTRLGLSVVAVTHDQAEAFALADRLVVIEAGRVLQQGPPAEVWITPASASVARLLGFANVAAASLESGRIVSPWGDLGPTDGPVAAVLVRPEGVAVDPDGRIEGTVTASTFAGARTRLTVAAPGAPDLDVEVAGPVGPPVGSHIRLRVTAGAVTALPS